MEILEMNQEGVDIQWFAVDVDGSIASFWSGGCILPKSVASDEESNDLLIDYFASLSEENFSNQSIGNKPNIRHDLLAKSLPNYGLSLEEIALRGVYAYDVGEAGRFLSSEYSLKAIPKRPLKVFELPQNISSILQKTKFHKRFPDSQRIGITEIP